jgi:hypothetical protein
MYHEPACCSRCVANVVGSCMSPKSWCASMIVTAAFPNVKPLANPNTKAIPDEALVELDKNVIKSDS